MIAPAVVADVDPSSPFSQDELFGPAVAVSKADDWESAIAQANGTAFGLAAGIFTSDVAARDPGDPRDRRRQHPHQLDAAVARRPHALRRAEGQRHRQGRPAHRRRRDDRREDGRPARPALVTARIHDQPSGSRRPSMTRREPAKGDAAMSNSRSGKTVRLTVAQAVVTYLSRQYSVADGAAPPADPRHPGHLRPRQRGRAGPGAGPAQRPDAVHAGPQRAVAGAPGHRLRQGDDAGARPWRSPRRSARVR